MCSSASVDTSSKIEFSNVDGGVFNETFDDDGNIGAAVDAAAADDDIVDESE